VTRAEISRRDQKRHSEALAAATAECRRLSPSARYDRLAISGEVKRMIAGRDAISAGPTWFWHGRMLERSGSPAYRPISFWPINILVCP
jgi:hypothetical protein